MGGLWMCVSLYVGWETKKDFIVLAHNLSSCASCVCVCVVCVCVWERERESVPGLCDNDRIWCLDYSAAVCSEDLQEAQWSCTVLKALWDDHRTLWTAAYWEREIWELKSKEKKLLYDEDRPNPLCVIMGLFNTARWRVTFSAMDRDI